jgi:hypothetical protein
MPTFDIYIVDGRSIKVARSGRLTEIVKEIEKEENGNDN